MTTPPADLTRIFDLATGFWRSSVLFTACELGLFDALRDTPATADEVGARLDLSPRGTTSLLESCAALGLLQREDGRFAVTDAAARCLTTSGDQSMLTTLRMQAATVPLWQRLADSVRTGEPAMPPSEMLGDDPVATRRFVLAMHERAKGVAQAMVEHVDLTGVSRLADIGGGPGTYAVLLAQRYPDLRVAVMDLPGVLEVARELVADTDVADRIDFRPCDATRDDFGRDFDAALVSGFVHRLDAGGFRHLLGRVRGALTGSGRVILCDLFADGAEPEMAVLFGLQMLLTSADGRTHQRAEVASWLSEAGFQDVRMQPLPPPLPHAVITAMKHTS